MTEPSTIETFDRTPDAPSSAWLRELMRRHGVSTVQAAGWLRVSPRAVDRWLSGERRLAWRDADLLRRIIRERFHAPRYVAP